MRGGVYLATQLNGRAAALEHGHRRKASTGSFQAEHKVALELGKRCKDAEDEPAGYGRGIDVVCQHLQTDAAFLQIADQSHNMRKRTTDPVQLPHHQSVFPARRVEGLRQSWTLRSAA